MAVGDSTADGVKTYGNLKGDTLVGRPSTNTDPNKPPGVLESIKAMPQAPAGTPLVIGTGLMNDVGPSGDISRANPAIVKAQIDAAKAKGYTPLVLGVGDKYANLNPQIKQIAEANGAKFVGKGEDRKVAFADGSSFTMDELIDRRLANPEHGPRIRKDAEKAIKDAARKAEKAKVAGGLSAAMLG